jgi:Fur family iron response transcriptional regulator
MGAPRQPASGSGQGPHPAEAPVVDGATAARLLRHAGLKVTRQRTDLLQLLMSDNGRRLTPEQLHSAAIAAGVRTSLATVYNTLGRLAEHGLLRRIVADDRKTFFDPVPQHHSHLYIEGTGELRDLPDRWFDLEEISRRLGGVDAGKVEVLVRIRSSAGLSAADGEDGAERGGKKAARS